MSSSGFPRRRPDRPGGGSALCVAVILAGACAAPPEAPLDPSAIADAAARRGASTAEVAEALALADVTPLAIGRPAPPEGAVDADGDAFWHACAFAWNPDVRAARRDLLVARARRAGAGLPGPIGAGGDHVGFTEAERETDLGLTFDLLGILGVGRSAAAAALASREERAALGVLEETVWAARHRTDRARAELAAGLLTEAGLQSLLAEAEEDWRRVELLDERGWLAPLPVAAARTMLHRLRIEVSDLRHDVAKARAALADLAGVPPEAPALRSLSARTLLDRDPARAEADPPAARALLERHPELRARRLEYAVAEARVRAAAAEAWPSIRIGPKLMLSADATLPGGILDLEIPFPGTADASVRAAVEERTKAGEKLEDTLVRRRNEIGYLRTKLRQDLENASRHAPFLENDSATAWRAARARFRSDPMGIDAWTMELERRWENLADAIAHRWHAVEAASLYVEACGPPDIAPLETAGTETARKGGTP